jgi:hypothetical protein
MIINLNEFQGRERCRGFQPPWYYVLVYVCKNCGRKHRLRVNWRGGRPPGAFRCGCLSKENQDRKEAP